MIYVKTHFYIDTLIALINRQQKRNITNERLRALAKYRLFSQLFRRRRLAVRDLPRLSPKLPLATLEFWTRFVVGLKAPVNQNQAISRHDPWHPDNLKYGSVGAMLVTPPNSNEIPDSPSNPMDDLEPPTWFDENAPPDNSNVPAPKSQPNTAPPKFNSYKIWLQQNIAQLEADLVNEARDFVESESGENVGELELDNKWHPLDKEQKKGYIGELKHGSNGKPYVHLTYNDFKGDKHTLPKSTIVDDAWSRYKADNPLPKFSKYPNAQEALEQYQSLPDQGHSAYLERKQVKPAQGMRFGMQGETPCLYVPMQSLDGDIKAVQLIADSKIFKIGGQLRDKHNPKGTSKNGLSFHIGLPPLEATKIVVTSGVATGLTIFQSGCADSVLCAFDDGNMLHVAAELDKKGLEFIVVADNDDNLAGISKARKILEKYPKARVTFPTDIKGTDFNDLQVESGEFGIEKVREQFSSNLSDLPRLAKSFANLTQISNEISNAKPNKDGDFSNISNFSIGDDANLLNSEIATPLQRELTSSSQDYPIESMGEILGGAARAMSEETQAPIAMCAQAVLSAASMAAQGIGDVKIGKYLKAPLSNFFLTLGESGERKTGVYNLALRAHNAFERELNTQYQHKLQELNQKKPVKGSDKDSDADKSRSPTMFVSEPTYEGLSKALEKGQPTMGIFSDEGARFLNGYAMGKENGIKTAAGLSSLWNGGAIDRSRSLDGTFKMYDRRLSCHLMLQPMLALNGLLTNDMLHEQGLTSRFLISYPKSTMGGRFYKEGNAESDAKLGIYWAQMTCLLGEYDYNNLGELNLRDLSLHSTAKEQWILFHDYCEANLLKEYSAIKSFANKAAEHAARLAGVIELVANPQAQVITEQSMLNGITLAKYYLSEMLRLNGAAIDPEMDKANKLLLWLKDDSTQKLFNDVGYIKNTVIYQRGPSFVRTAKKAMEFMTVLAEHGHVVLEQKGRTKLWILTKSTLANIPANPPAKVANLANEQQKQIDNSANLAANPAKLANESANLNFSSDTQQIIDNSEQLPPPAINTKSQPDTVISQHDNADLVYTDQDLRDLFGGRDNMRIDDFMVGGTQAELNALLKKGRIQIASYPNYIALGATTDTQNTINTVDVLPDESEQVDEADTPRKLVTFYQEPYPEWFEQSVPYDPYGDNVIAHNTQKPLDTPDIDATEATDTKTVAGTTNIDMPDDNWTPPAPVEKFMLARLKEVGPCNYFMVANRAYAPNYAKKCLDYWVSQGVVTINSNPDNPLYSMA